LAFVQWVQPDSVRRTPIHPGATYHYAWSGDGPWAVHLIRAALPERCDLGLEVLLPAPRERGDLGRERVSSMVERARHEHRRVVAAVNADFFTPEGAAVGAEIADGRVLAAEPRPVVAWRPGDVPWLGIASVTADTIGLGWSVSIDRGDEVTEAVGGFPDLLDAGARVGDLEVGGRPEFAAARHPRTAVGYDSRTGILWLVVVDGRQAPHSSGMTLPELAELFETLGADEAVNLDGGGSSVMVVGGRTVTRPSDDAGEREVVNALALVSDPMNCSVQR
jgi:hypothetical protein